MFLALLVLVPVVEIVAAVAVAHVIGLGWTLVLLVVLSLIGVRQVTVQGLGAWRRAVAEVQAGGSPALAALDGGMRLVGAVLVAVPGFVTALLGLVLLIGPIRRRAARAVGVWAIERLRAPVILISGRPFSRRGADGPSEVVDVEGWEETPGRGSGGTRPILDSPGPSRY